MSASATLDSAIADGLTITLTDAGKLRLVGKPSAIARWKDSLAAHRDAVIELVKRRASGSLRDRFPFAATHYDDLRDVFGSGVNMEYARENGQEWGTRLQPDQAGVPPSQVNVTTPRLGQVQGLYAQA